MSIASLAEFKEARGITGSNPTESPDAYLTAILDRASSKIETIVGRTLEKGTKTEYLSGDGTPYLNLKNGPINSLTSIETVAYDSAGSETLTAVSLGDFVIWGKLADGWKLPAYFESFATWVKGTRNYKVVTDCGWTEATDFPQDLIQACIFAANWMMNKRKDAASDARDIGVGSLGAFKGEQELDDELRRLVAAYTPRRILT